MPGPAGAYGVLSHAFGLLVLSVWRVCTEYFNLSPHPFPITHFEYLWFIVHSCVQFYTTEEDLRIETYGVY